MGTLTSITFSTLDFNFTVKYPEIPRFQSTKKSKNSCLFCGGSIKRERVGRSFGRLRCYSSNDDDGESSSSSSSSSHNKSKDSTTTTTAAEDTHNDDYDSDSASGVICSHCFIVLVRYMHMVLEHLIQICNGCICPSATWTLLQ